jgi:hypothetical protein
MKLTYLRASLLLLLFCSSAGAFTIDTKQNAAGNYGTRNLKVQVVLGGSGWVAGTYTLNYVCTSDSLYGTATNWAPGGSKTFTVGSNGTLTGPAGGFIIDYSFAFGGGNLTRTWTITPQSGITVDDSSLTWAHGISETVPTTAVVQTLTVYAGATPVQNHNVDFKLNYSNSGTKAGAVRIKINGVLADSLSIPAGTDANPVSGQWIVTRSKAEMTSGDWTIEAQNASGTWVEISSQTYFVGDPPEVAGSVNVTSLALDIDLPPNPDNPPPPATPPPDPKPEPAPPPARTTDGKRPYILKGDGNSTTDVYADVRNALNDAGNADTTIPPVSREVDLGDQPQGIGGGEGEAVMVSMDSTTTAIKAGVTSIKTNFASNKSLNLPTAGLGTVDSWSATLPVLGQFTVSITPYLSVISKMRAVCLFALYLGFWFVTVRVIRAAIA